MLRILGTSRFLILLAVLGTFIASATLLVFGLLRVIVVIVQLLRAGEATAEASKTLVADTVAIIDVFLPGKSGAMLMSRLRERFPEIVLIGTSALGDAGMARRCKGLGADIFIPKPSPMDALAEALKSSHVRWQ